MIRFLARNVYAPCGPAHCYELDGWDLSLTVRNFWASTHPQWNFFLFASSTQALFHFQHIDNKSVNNLSFWFCENISIYIRHIHSESQARFQNFKKKFRKEIETPPPLLPSNYFSKNASLASRPVKYPETTPLASSRFSSFAILDWPAWIRSFRIKLFIFWQRRTSCMETFGQLRPLEFILRGNSSYSFIPWNYSVSSLPLFWGRNTIFSENLKKDRSETPAAQLVD